MSKFSLFSSLTYCFAIFQWLHNDTWMVTGDHGGYIKYWQSNMNNVKMFQAHKEPVRDVSFSPTDTKFARYSGIYLLHARALQCIDDMKKCYVTKVR